MDNHGKYEEETAATETETARSSAPLQACRCTSTGADVDDCPSYELDSETGGNAGSKNPRLAPSTDLLHLSWLLEALAVGAKDIGSMSEGQMGLGDFLQGDSLCPVQQGAPRTREKGMAQVCDHVGQRCCRQRYPQGLVP